MRAALDEFRDGELEAAERSEIEAHLPSCPGCREEIEGARRAAFLFFPPAAEPAGFDAERFSRLVMARIAEEEADRLVPSRPAIPWRRRLVPAMAFVAAALALWVRWGSSGRESLAADILSRQRGGAMVLDWMEEPTDSGVEDLESAALAQR